jgi:hypothetical protein
MHSKLISIELMCNSLAFAEGHQRLTSLYTISFTSERSMKTYQPHLKEWPLPQQRPQPAISIYFCHKFIFQETWLVPNQSTNSSGSDPNLLCKPFEEVRILKLQDLPRQHTQQINRSSQFVRRHPFRNHVWCIWKSFFIWMNYLKAYLHIQLGKVVPSLAVWYVIGIPCLNSNPGRTNVIWGPPPTDPTWVHQNQQCAWRQTMGSDTWPVKDDQTPKICIIPSFHTLGFNMI